jgi:hypothetical protein
MSFDPTNVDFNIPRGSEYIGELNFLANLKEKTPYSVESLTSWKWVVEGVATLKIGEGLEKPASNKLRFTLSRTQTSVKESAHHYLEVWEGEKGPWFIIKGTMYFETP